MDAYVRVEPVPGEFFSVKITVEGLPPELNTFRNHLDAARPHVMRYFNIGMHFKVKSHCTWRLRDPDEGQSGTINLTTIAVDVLNGMYNSINTWEELVAWLEHEEGRKKEIAENSQKEFESVVKLILLIHPSPHMRAGGLEIDLDDLEPPEPEPQSEEDEPELAHIRSDFVKLPQSLVNKMACINIVNQDCRSF